MTEPSCCDRIAVNDYWVRQHQMEPATSRSQFQNPHQNVVLKVVSAGNEELKLPQHVQFLLKSH